MGASLGLEERRSSRCRFARPTEVDVGILGDRKVGLTYPDRLDELVLLSLVAEDVRVQLEVVEEDQLEVEALVQPEGDGQVDLVEEGDRLHPREGVGVGNPLAVRGYRRVEGPSYGPLDTARPVSGNKQVHIGVPKLGLEDGLPACEVFRAPEGALLRRSRCRPRGLVPGLGVPPAGHPEESETEKNGG